MKKKSISVVLFVFYTVFIAFVSLQPASGISIGNWDKVFHLASYAVFAVLAYGVVQNPRHYIYLCVAIVAYGALMEFGQSFMPGRFMSGYDFLANTLGVMLGAVMVVKLGDVLSDRQVNSTSN
jgi:VanZ family protein